MTLKLLAIGLAGFLLAGCAADEWAEDSAAMYHATAMYYSQSWDPVCGDKVPFTTCMRAATAPPPVEGPYVHVVPQ
jgi:hypothetical protein